MAWSQQGGQQNLRGAMCCVCAQARELAIADIPAPNVYVQTQLVVLFGAMFACHILQGILTEYVAHGVLSGLMWAAASIELSVYAALSLTEARLTGLRLDARHTPWKLYMLIAVCISVGRGLTWVGYGSLSYPSVLLFKSSKIIVVMISGLVLLRTKHAPSEYLAAVLAVAGLYLFSSAGRSSEGAGDSASGFAMMLLAVCCEATVSTLQEHALKHEHRPLAEMILVTNALGAALLWAVAATRGELSALHERVHERPAAVGWLLLTVVLAYGGSYAFTAAIKAVGAVVATGMGICRKLASVLASYAIFPKEMHPRHASGLALFFAGLALSWAASAPQSVDKEEREDEDARGEAAGLGADAGAGPHRRTRHSLRAAPRTPPAGVMGDEGTALLRSEEDSDGWVTVHNRAGSPAEASPAPSPPRSHSSSPPRHSPRRRRSTRGAPKADAVASGAAPLGPAGCGAL
jgi:adenosine 3'-phospho 5'-phosphosulfate transporter B3